MAMGMTPPAAMPVAARTSVSISKLRENAASTESSASRPRQTEIVRSLPTESAIGPRNGWPIA